MIFFDIWDNPNIKDEENEDLVTATIQDIC